MNTESPDHPGTFVTPIKHVVKLGKLDHFLRNVMTFNYDVTQHFFFFSGIYPKGTKVYTHRKMCTCWHSGSACRNPSIQEVEAEGSGDRDQP